MFWVLRVSSSLATPETITSILPHVLGPPLDLGLQLAGPHGEHGGAELQDQLQEPNPLTLEELWTSNPQLAADLQANAEAAVADKQEALGSDALDFQNTVRGAFTELGENLDMEEVAIEKERAMEQWAQRKQMAALRKEMGIKMGDLDDKSRKLLEEHAAEMAKKMQALILSHGLSLQGSPRKKLLCIYTLLVLAKHTRLP